MKKDLQKRLVSYSRLAGAAAVLAPLSATGEIVYTDVEPDLTLGIGEAFEIDLNDDGTLDMVVGIGTAAGTLKGDPLYFQAAFASGSGQGSFAGSTQIYGTTPFYFPEAYNAGDAINSSLAWQTPDVFGSLNFITSIASVPAYTGGNWINKNDKYLAVRFTLGSVQHYGWVRMSVGEAGLSNFVTIKGFAFEAVADEPIEAGLETGGAVPSGFSAPDYGDQVNCYSFGNTIFVQSLDAGLQEGTLEVLNLAGQQVYTGEWKEGNASVVIEGASQGLHLVRIRVADGVVSRKVYLSGDH